MRLPRLRNHLALLSRAALILGGLGAAGGVGASPALAAAKSGSVSGTVAGKLPKGGESTVVATSLTDGSVVGAFPVSKRGAFRATLPAGAYTLGTVVVPAPGGGALSTSRLPVTLRSGQRRTKIAVKTKRAKARKAALATRAYVQESGAVTAGIPAFTVENFTGGTGDWAPMGAGLTALLISDLTHATQCDAAVIANQQDRALIEKELNLQKSRYFDPKARVKRNFIISDLTVNGTLTVSADGGSAAVHVTITDARTGGLVDTIDATLHEGTVFDQETELAKAIGERVCRRPAAYDVTLAVAGTGTFATHSATGHLDAKLTAIRSGGAAGKPATNWSGTGSLAWSSVAAASNTDCSYGSAVTPGASWTVGLAVSGDTDLKVDWDTAGTDMATLTATCPIPDHPPAIIPGQAGPALLGITPKSATIPLGGGSIPLSGGLDAPGGGWTNTGTLVVSPIWAVAAPR